MATVTGTRRLLDISGNNISTAVSLEAEGTLLDSNGQSGTSNQVLISTATGVDWVDGSGSGIIGGPYLPVNNPTFTGALTGPSATITGNTLLGNSNGDYVHVNDRLFVGATDSGNAEFWFGEGATGDVNYGAHWHWDSGYTHKWFTVNNSSETLMMSYATNDTSKVNWYRDVDIQDNDILIDSSHGFINSGSWTRNATPHGYIDFGPANTSHAHIYTDRPNFYFNKALTVNGSSIINQNDIRSKIFYDVDNTSYYADFGSGQIVLGGTGRIQGIDTVSASTDAANKAYVDASHPTVNNGTLNMTTSTGLDGGATFTANQSGTSSFAVSLDLSELADMTQTMIGADEFIVLDNGAERRKAANEIGLSIFNNDAGFTTNTGDITAVFAGTGLTGGGTSGSVTLNVAANTYTPYNDIRSLGVEAFTNGTNPNITTAQVMDEIDSDGGFDSYSSVFKTSWSYAGNYNLTDAGRFTETAGSSWITWTDNSSDSTRGNITTLAIAPNTGGSAGKVFIYNNQGGSYSPGWREVWTNLSDGAGSGLDADLLDGQQGSYYLNYANFTGTPTIPTVGNGQIDGRTSGLGLSGSMDATANQSGNTTFTVTSNAATAANANTIAYRTSSADIRARLFRSNYANQSTISGGMAFRVNNGADDFIRFCSDKAAIRTFLGVPASGDLNSYLLNTTDTFTGALTIAGDIRGNGQQLVLNAGESYSYATGQTNEHVYANAEGGLIVSSSPDNWSSGWAGRNTTYIGKADGTSSFSGQISVQGSSVIEIDQGYSYLNHLKLLSTFGSKLFSATNYGYVLESSSTPADPVTFRFDNDRYRIYSGSSGEALTVLANTNVGIGTTSPADKLHVNGTVRSQAPASTDWGLASFNSSGNAQSGLWFSNGDGELLLRDDSSNLNVRLRSDASSYINGGSLGLGTTSPNLKLDVISGTNNGIRISATDTTSNWRDIDIRSYVSQAQANALPDGSAIYTTNPTSQTETAFSKFGGLVLQGRDDGNSSFAIRLGNGNGYATRMFMGATGATVFSNTVTATNFILSSDERLKENVKKVCNNRVKADWKTFELKTDKGQKRYGVIAQELEKTNPEFVREDSEGFKSVAYIDLLIAKIAELETRIQKLEK